MDGVGVGGLPATPPSALFLPALSSLPPTELSETLSAAPQEPPEAPRCSCKVALKGIEIRMTLTRAAFSLLGDVMRAASTVSVDSSMGSWLSSFPVLLGSPNSLLQRVRES